MSASVVLLARSASTTTRPPRRLLSLRRGCCIGLDVDPRHPREDAFDGRGGWVRGDRRTRHTRHTRWGRQPAGVSSSGREEATTSVEDLTRPGLTPWQVLGIDEDDVAVVTLAEVKAAFRARMKVYHPDVYRGDGDGEAMARRIVAAYRAVMEVEGSSGDAATMAEWDGVNDVFPWARPGADPFEDPEGPADDVFVNAFECRGRGRCPSYCCCVVRRTRDETTIAATRLDRSLVASTPVTWRGRLLTTSSFVSVAAHASSTDRTGIPGASRGMKTRTPLVLTARLGPN